MKSFLFKNLLQAEGWKSNVKIIVNDHGIIEKIEENHTEITDEKIIKIAIPGIPNAHSHAFQYAMSGIAENHALNAASDFWSWRNAMYSLALSIDPDDMQNIATMLYSEMLNNGYTSVAEFHYLHHDKNGNPYDNKIEMSERLMIAAKKFIASATRYLVFEQNTSETRNRFLSIVNPYLESVQQRQGLYAFKVVMDESNNTPDVIDRNEMVGQLFLQPTRTAEFIIIDFNVLPTGATFPS